MAGNDMPQGHLLTRLLKDVSRSFYLTLRALPGAIRPQIGLAYLLARATDTVADTTIVPVAERLEALDTLRARILGQSSAKLDFTRFVTTPCSLPAQASLEEANQDLCATRRPRPDAERILLGRIEEALVILAELAPRDRERIREVLATITSGQELDLRRFAGADRNHIVALASDGDLEDYTYRVAGCVGEFWTKMCRAHLFPEAKLDEATLLDQGVCFGKGLQLVNILRDLSADLKMGRCYLPLDQLAERGLEPSDLWRQENEARLRPLYVNYLDRAEAYLAAGWSYTNALPYRCVRVRLACAWPILIGMQTLSKLRSTRALHSDPPVKIARKEVKRLIIRSVMAYPMPRWWNQLFKTATTCPSKPVASARILE